MSRIFDGVTGNHLSFTGSLGLVDPFTVLYYIKKTSNPVTYDQVVFEYRNAVTGSKDFNSEINIDGTITAAATQQYSNGAKTTVGTLPLSVWEPILINFSAGRPTIETSTENTGIGGNYGVIQADESPNLVLGNNAGVSAFNTLEGKLSHFTIWSSVLSAPDVALIHAGDNPATVSVGTLVENWPFDTNSLVGTVGGTTLVLNGAVPQDSDSPVASILPTLSGPDTATVNSVRTATGSFPNTIAAAGLKISDDSYSKSLTIDSQNNTQVVQTDNIDAGLSLGNPVASLPVETTIDAAGFIADQIQQWVSE